MSNTVPNLLFGPGPNDGFTSGGIAAFDDLREGEENGGGRRQNGRRAVVVWTL